MNIQDKPFFAVTRLLPKKIFGGTPNLFGWLIIIAGAAGVLRLSDIALYALDATKDAPPPGMTRSATAQDIAQPPPATLSDEAAPPLTQSDIDRNVKDSATAPAPASTPAEQTNAGTAKEPAPAVATPAPVTPASAPLVPTPAPLAPTDGREYSESELDVLQSLSKRRDALDQRERNLNESAALLKAAEKEVDRKLSELSTLKSAIERLLGQQEQMEDARITSLVKIYEAMKPKEAAIIFNTLDADVLLAVVGRMNERRLSPILASMDPDKARMVTIRLAEQRQLPSAGQPPQGTFGSDPSAPPALPDALDAEDPVQETTP